MIDPTLVDEIAGAYEKAVEEAQYVRVTLRLPERQLLLTFIESAFLASIKDEEGKPVAFSLVFAEPSDLEEPSHQVLPHTLSDPILLTPASIAKLAPAVDPKQSSIAVRSDDTKRSLLIWGIFSFEPSAPNFLTRSWSGIRRPDYFTASSQGRGSLVFSRGDKVVGRLSSGYFSPASHSPFADKSLGGYWLRLLRSTSLYAHSARASEAEDLIKGALPSLVKEAAERGHGATIVVLDALAPTPTSLFSPKYTLKVSPSLGTMFAKALSSFRDPTAVTYSRKEISEALQRLAQLACIDGALVVDSTFRILGFGATLTAPSWSGRVEIGPDEHGNRTGRPFDIGRYGTRHRSGLDFAGACPGSLVFVASQDGPVRAFTRTDESTILCWPDCTLSRYLS